MKKTIYKIKKTLWLIFALSYGGILFGRKIKELENNFNS